MQSQQTKAGQRRRGRRLSVWSAFCWLCNLCLLCGFLPSAVLSRCSREAEYLVSKGGECFNRQDFGCAKISVEDVLSREPECARALHLKSFLLERDGRTEAAEALRERAEKLDPKLKEFWRERGHDIEGTLSSQEFSHFELRFHGAENRDRAWQAVKYLNEAYNYMGSRFGVFPSKKITVIIYNSPEFLDAWRSPFLGGFFDQVDGKVRLRVDEFPGGDLWFQQVSRHEFTHAFLHQLVGDKLPRWIEEGIAEYYARAGVETGFWMEERIDQFRRAFQGKPWMDADQMNKAALRQTSNAMEMFTVYYQAELIVLTLVKDRGESWIPQMIRRMQGGMSFRNAYREVIGADPETTVNKLGASLRS